MTRDNRCTSPAGLRVTLVVLLLLVAAHGAVAATFQVTNLSDAGPGSLRQAVLDANASAGPDEVTFAPGLAGTITLTSGEIRMTDHLVVQGPGAFALTVDANHHSRIFNIGSGMAALAIDVTLSGLTLTRGFSTEAGGAVAASGNLTILDSVISQSVVESFGGLGCGGNVVFSEGNLRIAHSLLVDGSAQNIGTSSGGNLCVLGGQLLLERSTVSGGSADGGGGLFLQFPAENRTILLSTISGNRAGQAGGGIFSHGTTLTIDSSTISGNTAPQGAGVFTLFDTWIVNSTISGNVASDMGGGLSLIFGSHSLLLTTISNNTAGTRGGSILVGESFPSPTTVELDHAIVANGAPQDLAGEGLSPATVTANYSLIEAPGTVALSGANNLVGVDPLLGPLTNNGGPTLTHALLPGSPALDAGNPAIPSPPPTDQRGFGRIVGPAVDLGSVEQQPGSLTVEVPTLSQVGALVLSGLLLALGVRRLRRGGALLVLLILISAHGAVAATFQVANLSDAGPGSLRQAVLDANASVGPDEVTFAPGLAGTITLTSGEMLISDDLVVHGPGASALTIDAHNDSKIFRIEKSSSTVPIDVTLSGLMLIRGFGDDSGAVGAYQENLTILDSVISGGSVVSLLPLGIACGGNVGVFGATLRIVNSLLTSGTVTGGEFAAGGNLCVMSGQLILERSTLTNGTSDYGGGVFNFLTVRDGTISHSTISGNHAEHSGGGLYNHGAASLTIDSSTISGNTSSGAAGLYTYADLRIVNGTISGNAAAGSGGGIHWVGGALFLLLTTISNNTADTEGGSILLGERFSSAAVLDHSIVANGTPQDLANEALSSATVTANYSLVEAPGNVPVLGGHNLVGVDPLLGPLANNGGPTLTHAPLPSSPVLDAGNPAIPSPPPTDQRGFARIVGPAVDLGSVEQQPGPLTVEVPTLSQVGALVLSGLLLALGVRRLRRGGALVVLLSLISAHGAAAATFQVANLSDAGPGSLRQAVLDANALAGPDEVTFLPGLTGTITLTSGEILISDHLVVHGPGAGVMSVSGNESSRIFRIENSSVTVPIDVTLSGLTLTRGFSSSDFAGAVAAFGENLTILDSVVSHSRAMGFVEPPSPGCGGNVGSSGGALRIVNSLLTGGTVFPLGSFVAAGGNLCVIAGRLILERSTVSGGTADFGGGLYLLLPAENRMILQSTITGNHAEDAGGGIYSHGATLTIDSSTISENTAPNDAGVLSLSDLEIVNSTISGNVASEAGGGISCVAGTCSLLLTTILNNEAGTKGGSIIVRSPSTSTIELDHVIVANGAPQDLAGDGQNPTTVTANYSLIEAPGDVSLVGANNLVGVDPLLGPLANNGGPTLTHAPLPGSPVIDAGNPAIPSPPPTDQRGFARIVGPAVDLGSVEQQPGTLTVEVPTLSQIGALVLSGLLLALGVRRLRQGRSAGG